MKIYTRTGDKGKTSLVSGNKVDKFHTRVCAYGTVDELSAVLGVTRSHILAEGNPSISPISESLALIQNRLFTLGSLLASDEDTSALPQVDKNWTLELEKNIDEMTEKIPKQTEFILPGGAISSSYTHLARTVCRRAERDISKLVHDEKVDEKILIYVNRLSDYFQVLARYINHTLGIKDVTWKK